jgi:hypothetical protein
MKTILSIYFCIIAFILIVVLLDYNTKQINKLATLIRTRTKDLAIGLIVMFLISVSVLGWAQLIMLYFENLLY